METAWFRKRKEILEAQDVNNYVQMFCNEYKTDCVATKVKQVLADQKYCVEVWVNLYSGAHVVNLYSCDGELAEDDCIID